MLQHLFPKEVKVDVSIDEVRIKSTLKPNQTLIFLKKSLIIVNLGFTQSHSYLLDDWWILSIDCGIKKKR